MTDRTGRGTSPIDHAFSTDATGSLPPELIAERARVRRLAAAASQRAMQGRFGRRALLPVAVASGVLAGSGLLSAWARATTPASGSAARQPAVASLPGHTPSKRVLREFQQALRTDEQAIASLPQVATSSLAASAGSTPAVTPESSSAPAATPALPAISIPAISAPPVVHATTGASGIP